MRFSWNILLTLLLTIAFRQCRAYRILGIFPINARSHMIIYEEMMKGLAQRGHQVDVISTFPQKKSFPNYTNILIPTAQPNLFNNMSFDDMNRLFDADIVVSTTKRIGNFYCETVLEYPELQEIIENPPKDPPYNLVIIPYFATNCFMAFGHHLNIPVIAISTSSIYPWLNQRCGNPENLAISPSILLAYDEKMNFWMRFHNVIHTFYYKFIYDYYTDRQTNIIRKHFGPNTPSVRELEQSVALILTNSHFSLNGVKSIAPSVIEVGGLHVQDNSDLEIPLEVLKWLDESKDGFLYFTFGSMIAIEKFPEHILRAFSKSFSKIAPIRVLMKVLQPNLLPFNFPSNVRTFKWMPQIKIFQHKNIRAFISHGGTLSIQEALTYGIPMIGIPLFADQMNSVDLIVKKQVAIRIDKNNITEENLDAALNEILHNSIYKRSMEKLSRRFLDRPLGALETACFWVEYIIKHGSKALRSPTLDLAWWQIALLDVYAFIIFIAIILIVIFTYLSMYIIKMLSPKKTTKLCTNKKNN